MTLASVQGQARAVGVIQASLNQKKIHHAWLFHGPDGVGKELAALRMAAALVCAEKPWVGCGECDACTRVAKFSHPDVSWVMPEVEQIDRGLSGRSDFASAPSRDIRIDQIRKLQERLAFHALESAHKIALIVTAHAMNQPAQNALLKTLEEPPRDTILILISSAPDKLLPTIRSRCAKAAFGPLSTEFIAQKIVASAKKKDGIDEALATQMALMSSGSVARALALNPGALAKRKNIIEGFERLSPHDASGWVLFAEVMGEDKPTAESALHVLQVWHHDVALAQVGALALVNADLADVAMQSAGRLSAALIQRRAGLIEEAKNAITYRNGSPRLQLERMLIEMFSA
jgi:DNA polymerase-3 subunit delta'